MRGLHTVAWRGLARRKARSALTAFAVMLGVANVFGVFVVNASIDRGVERRTRLFAGRADVVVYPGPGAEFGLSREQIEEMRRLPGTHLATGVMDAFDSDHPKGNKDETVFIGAIDEVGRREVVAERLIEGRLFRVGRPEIVLSRRASEALGKGIGDEWRTDLTRLVGASCTAGRCVADEDLPSPKPSPLQRLADDAEPIQRFEITGIVSDPPGASAGFGSFTSIEHIWKIYELDLAGQVRVFLEDGIDQQAWVAAAEERFPGRRFESSALAPEVTRFVQTLQGLLAGTSALALFVGAFLIYLTFSISVVERMRLYGSLHAIGARGRQVATAVLGEALIIGIAATAAGIVVGLGLSIGLVRLVTRVVPVPVETPSLTPAGLLAGVAVGLAATLIGVAVPAIRAARMSPVEAIRASASMSQRTSRAWIVGAVLLAAGVAVSATVELTINVVSSGAAIAVLAGSVLLVPPLLGPLARALRRLARWVAPGLGDVAVSHVTRERSRSAYTLALVMVVLAAMVTVGATNASFGTILDRWLDKRFGADLLVYGPRIDGDFQRRIERLDGVSATTTLDFSRRVQITQPAREAQNLILIDPDSFFDVAGFPWAQGTDEGARAALTRGSSVLLPSAAAARIGVRFGQQITLSIGDRSRDFTVAGLYATFGTAPEIGVVAGFRDSGFFRPDETRDVIYLNFERDASRDSVIEELEPILAPGNERVIDDRPQGEGPAYGRNIGSHFVISGAEIKQQARSELAAFVRVFLAVVLIAAIVGVLGMANTLAASVLLRFRELGILQALGAGPRTVRRMVIAESFVLTFAAFALSLGLGALLAWMFNTGAAVVGGFTVPLVLPWTLLPVLAAAAAAIAYLAAIVPADRASRLTPVEALRYE